LERKNSRPKPDYGQKQPAKGRPHKKGRLEAKGRRTAKIDEPLQNRKPDLVTFAGLLRPLTREPSRPLPQDPGWRLAGATSHP